MGTWGPSTAKHPSRNTAANVFHAGTWSKSTTSIDKDSIRTASSTNTIVAEPGIMIQVVVMLTGYTV